MKKIVAVGMSGGVDSSVAALLLKQAGWEVVGLFMKNWEDKEQTSCSSAVDFEDVAKVCHLLDIPYYTLNFSKEYRNTVFSQFLAGYRQGLTPNPDILCNREIKFHLFLKKAKELGATFLATGHYAKKDREQGEYVLYKGDDPNKDQSYFIYTLNQEILKEVLFPVGHLKKSQVRQIAKEHQLPTAFKKDSVGICFIGKRDFRPFLGKYLGFSEGFSETLDGKTVGKHEGAAFFTIGQRKGLSIGGKGEAWYVAGKDMQRNVLFVVQGEHHPALFADTLIASELSWISGKPPSFPKECWAKIRYRQRDQKCQITNTTQDTVVVTFEQPQRAITPLQSIVFYEGQKCLGGGLIQQVGPSYYEQKKPLPNNFLFCQ